MHQRILLAIIYIFWGKHVQAVARFNEVFSWTELDWDIPLAMKQNEQYVPRNGLPVGIERWNDKLFVSVPRWRDGIPATLNYIDLNRNPSGFGVPLIPYPSLPNNVAGDCDNGLNTVYRIKVDKCDRLWVLDVGTTGIGDDTLQLCPYAINIFDLNTNQRVRRYEFRAEDTNANTFIANTLIDMGDKCEDTYAYFSDELGYGLIVYSFEENTSWRFEHSFFFPDPLRGDFNIGGLNFQWADEGIFGTSLGPKLKDGTRSVFFSPLASHREFYVSNDILKNSSKPDDSYHDFNYLEERAENGHTTSRVIDEVRGVQLFNLIDLNGVGCWDTRKAYTPANHGMVDQDNETMIFPADVKVDADQNVWMISDRMPNFLIAELDYTDVNFRIFTARLDDLVADTVCDPRVPATPKNLLSGHYDGLNSLSHSSYPLYDHTPTHHTPDYHSPDHHSQSHQSYPQSYYQGPQHHDNGYGSDGSWGHTNDAYSSSNYHFNLEGGHEQQREYSHFW